jgi:hypothetical protein
MVARGGAMADYDGDGLVDLVISRHGSTPLLLHNTTADAGHWVRLELRQLDRNTRALGAKVELHAADRRFTAQVNADASYLSQHDTVLHVGLGETTVIDELVITWPDGVQDRHESLPVDRTHRIVRAERDEVSHGRQ